MRSPIFLFAVLVITACAENTPTNEHEEIATSSAGADRASNGRIPMLIRVTEDLRAFPEAIVTGEITVVDGCVVFIDSDSAKRATPVFPKETEITINGETLRMTIHGAEVPLDTVANFGGGNSFVQRNILEPSAALEKCGTPTIQIGEMVTKQEHRAD